MLGSPKVQTKEDNGAVGQEAQHSYDSHSGKGLYNKGFSSSKETDLARQMEKIEQTDYEFSKSNLPLVDSLLAYKNDDRLNTPLVPPRRIKVENKDTNKDISNGEDLQTNRDEALQTSDIVFYPENVNEIILARKSVKRQSRGVQVWLTPPYRLKVLPEIKGDSKSKFGINTIGKIIFCQVGLGTIIFLWALAGAAAFRYTEGPREERVTLELVQKQKHLVNTLMEELQKDTSNKNEWYETIEKYMMHHEQLLKEGGNGMGHNGNGHVWTLPGCILFAISLITTLGFGAPVPQTPGGRGVAIAFAAVGIPLHLLLVLNVGMVIAVKLQSLSNRGSKSDKESQANVSNDISKTESKIVDSYHKSSKIFNNNCHKRTGSEPIGKQALQNITNQTAFCIDQSKEIKYFYITETDNVNEDSKDIIKQTDKINDTNESDDDEQSTVSKWLKWIPFCLIFMYFLMGFFLFGIARYKSFMDSLMFPLDFTVAGGVAQTPGHVRVLYALYLEGAVVLTAVTVSVLQTSATQGLTNLGLKYNLLTNSR